MNIEEFRDFCLSKKGATEDFPFDETTLVFKVMGKMFALTDTEDEFSINLKCDPEKALELREKFPNIVKHGYHMSKKHWNTIIIEGSIPDKLIYDWIDHSYELVVAKLSKSMKEKLN